MMKNVSIRLPKTTLGQRPHARRLEKMMKNVSIRLPKRALEIGDSLAGYEFMERSAIFRRALLLGLEKIRIEDAIRLYSEGKLSMSEASDLAGVSVGEMLEIMSERGVKKNIGLEDVGDSIKNALKRIS